MATREVVPGQSINTAITASASGDTVLVRPGAYAGGINMNRNGVMLEFDEGVVVRGNNAGQAIAIMASDINIVGRGKRGTRVVFEDFRSGIGSNQITGRNNVGIHNITQRRTNYGFWISGDNWQVWDCEADRIIKRDTGGDADYGRVFGNGHHIKRCWFHGTNIPTDITPGHTDALQFYNQNGEVLKNLLVEDCVFTDVVQFFFLGNETGSTTSMSDITIRNCVLWGTRFASGGIYLGAPSWTLYAGKNGPIKNLVFENNTLTTSSNYLGVISGTTAKVRKNICAAIGTKLGSVWILEGNSPSNIDTAGGNMHWNYNWRGEMSPATDILNVDPQFGATLLGPSGDPWGLDAGWRPKNLAAAGFGAQSLPTGGVTPIPPDVTAPHITILGANPMLVANGSVYADPGATATDNGASVPVTTSGSVNTAVAGNYMITYSARDAVGNTSLATRAVTVAAVIPPPSTDMATQAELDAAVAALNQTISALRAELLAADATERAARIAADSALTQRIDGLPVPMTPQAIADAIAAAIKGQPKVTVIGVTP